MEKVEEFDVVVIGAGLSGIAFARLYLEIHPQCRLVILDAEESVGGTWCKGRVHDEFRVQSSARMASFSDAEVKLPYGAPTYHGTFPAKYVTQYLEAYVDEHVYDGSSIRSRIRFGHYVTEIDKFDGQWHVLVEEGPERKENIIAGSKLVVATGRTSDPNVPQLLNSEQYKGLVVHHRDFGQLAEQFKQSKQHEHVAVLGGGKAASDMVYECVKQGRQVSWIIRKNGEGPCVYAPAEGEGRYINSVEKDACRLSQAFSPSSFTPRFHISRLIHKSSYGRKTTMRRVANFHQNARQTADYRNREGAQPGFENLNFEGNLWWMTAPYALTTHEDHWSVISQNVRIYRADVDHMTSDSLILDDGTEVRADAVLCGTGWTPPTSYPFFSSALAASLGLPHEPSSSGDEEAPPSSSPPCINPAVTSDDGIDSTAWVKLLTSADEKVLRRFPTLARPPPHMKPPSPSFSEPSCSSVSYCGAAAAPFKPGPKPESKPESTSASASASALAAALLTTSTPLLHRLIAPLPPAGEQNGLKSRSLVLLGIPAVSNSFRVAEVQALWSTAWLDGTLRCPSLDRVRRQIAYTVAFSRRRYPSHGGRGDCLMWESIAYTDCLLKDLGLRSHLRAQGGLFGVGMGRGEGKGEERGSGFKMGLGLRLGRWRNPCVAADLRGLVGEYKRKYKI